MRFLADENVSHIVIERLRASGFDITSLGEIKSGASDENVLGAANSDGCVLITEDRDFGELVAAGAACPIAVAALRRSRPEIGRKAGLRGRREAAFFIRAEHVRLGCRM